jgi:hypothetical protein
MGRTLTSVALALALLSMLASIILAWASVWRVMPKERLLLADSPASVRQKNVNAEGKPPLSPEELNWRHIQVTAAHGKIAVLTALSITLSGVGTFTVLLLVIFNRRVTLRQINASLAQISDQIAQLRNRQGPAPG